MCERDLYSIIFLDTVVDSCFKIVIDQLQHRGRVLAHHGVVAAPRPMQVLQKTRTLMSASGCVSRFFRVSILYCGTCDSLEVILLERYVFGTICLQSITDASRNSYHLAIIYRRLAITTGCAGSEQFLAWDVPPRYHTRNSRVST